MKKLKFNDAKIFIRNLRREKINLNEIAFLLKQDDKNILQALRAQALELKEKYYGKKVFLRGIIEFSNMCSRGCFYCGIRQSNKKIKRYKMMAGEIIKQAEKIAAVSIKTIVLQSGEDDNLNKKEMVYIISEIIKKHDIRITLSIGEHPYKVYKELYDAGAKRYLLKLETASEELYKKLHPRGMKFKNRLKCLKDLKKIGYQTGTGNMVGLPYQTEEDIALDIKSFKELDADMVSVGPFISHPDTPLHNLKNGTIDTVLKTTAVARILCPKALMPATTATGTIDSLGREKTLLWGANVVMPNLTPLEYKKNYEIYPDKRCITEDPFKCRFCIANMIKKQGFIPDLGFGDRAGFKRKKAG